MKIDTAKLNEKINRRLSQVNTNPPSMQPKVTPFDSSSGVAPGAVTNFIANKLGVKDEKLPTNRSEADDDDPAEISDVDEESGNLSPDDDSNVHFNDRDGNYSKVKMEVKLPQEPGEGIRGLQNSSQVITDGQSTPKQQERIKSSKLNKVTSRTKIQIKAG